MGTNIYARINPPKAEREKFVLKVKEIVDSDELFMFSKLNDLIQEYKYDYPEVHLGKRSMGWQFIWASNPKYYDNTIASINKFLQRDDVVLYNEYGEYLTPEDVWEFYGNTKGYTLEDYLQDYPRGRRHYTRNDYETVTKEGLRIARDADFC
jgi:hypothetical protein